MEKSITLIGMMGSGKTTLGMILSHILGIPFKDTDALIEKKMGKSIERIFEEHGETYFRNIESDILRDVLNDEPSVIATGGGIILSEKNRKYIKEKSIPIFLYADIDILAERLAKVKNRPLLKGYDLKDRIYTIWKERKVFYEEFENRIDTAKYTPHEVAEKIVSQILPPKKLSYITESIAVGRGITRRLHEFLVEDYKEPALVITSHPIWERWGDYIENSLKDFKRKIFFLPEGESAKSMEYVYKLWEEMFSLDFTRKNPVLLIGGGTIGDTGGFAASTFMRGVPIIQLPTTLLSQLDSSIGGKRGVNYKHLKNMIGTFYDATYTVLDPVFLLSLPEREIKNGLSEAIKSAIIGSSDLFDFINTHITEIFSYNLSILEVVVKKTVKIKLDVVSKDPYELTGYRKVLNLGHTLGHALESIEDFSISHGEGVSIGMAFAAFLGEKEGITPVKIRDKIVKLIKKSGLPISLPDVDIKMLIKKMYYDKKREDEKIFWVIPEDIGRVGFYKFDPNKVEYFIREFSKGIS